MTKAKKRTRVEMIDSRGNIARPWPEDVEAWEVKGWQRVQPVKAGKAKDNAGTATPESKGNIK